MTPEVARIEQTNWTATLEIRYVLTGAPDLQLTYGKRIFAPDTLVVTCEKGAEASESWLMRNTQVSGLQRLNSGSTGTVRYDNEYWGGGRYRALPEWLTPLVDSALATANARHLFVGEASS